jgi:hypothetical protein
MAMISIDFAHAGITPFHFPLAEFVSGYCQNITTEDTEKILIFRELKKLLFPPLND